ncbi:MAG: hypothetical protein FJ009_09155 [Chloroflexi bacterium]|nr:hypothetical protein [Chloroflexota bacterium]
MNPELTRIWFRVAVFMTLGSAVLIPLQKPDTAEFVISVTSFIIGLAFLAALIVLARRANH